MTLRCILLGLSIVPSGQSLPMNVALAIQNLVTLVEAASGVPRGVRVGSTAGVPAEGVFAAGALEAAVFARGGIVARANGVSVTDADCVFWACTVIATAVAMMDLLDVQDVKAIASRSIVFKNRLNFDFICFLSFNE